MRAVCARDGVKTTRNYGSEGRVCAARNGGATVEAAPSTASGKKVDGEPEGGDDVRCIYEEDSENRREKRESERHRKDDPGCMSRIIFIVLFFSLSLKKNYFFFYLFFVLLYPSDTNCVVRSKQGIMLLLNVFPPPCIYRPISSNL